MAKFAFLSALLVAAASVEAAIPAHLHPKRHLFERQSHLEKRQSGSDGYPPILTIPDPSLLKQEWKDALQAAVKNGTIPDIPKSTLDSNGNPSYPSNAGSDNHIGSWTLSKYLADSDISQAPNGVWAIGFDDGPTDESPPMYKYLQSQSQVATHFMIGSNIISYPDAFAEANNTGGQLAVHTWSHKLQTASTNEEVLGDLAWTMQVIYDRTGRIPNLWRPPQGDVDNRVRAIAYDVLGLRTVLWQADANDWCLNDQFETECPADNTIGQSRASVTKYVQQHIQGSKNPGIIMLAHEIHKPSIAIFKDYYPSLAENGWKTQAVGDFDDVGGYYANAANNTSPTSGQSGVIAADVVSSTSSSAAASGTSGSKGQSSMSTMTASRSASSSGATSGSQKQEGTTSGASTVSPVTTIVLTAGVALVAAVML
ncbi:unnamed protein product [Jaminaea pallidilutea]